MKSVATIMTGEKEKERGIIPPAAGTKRHLCNWTSKKRRDDLPAVRDGNVTGIQGIPTQMSARLGLFPFLFRG